MALLHVINFIIYFYHNLRHLVMEAVIRIPRNLAKTNAQSRKEKELKLNQFINHGKYLGNFCPAFGRHHGVLFLCAVASS